MVKISSLDRNEPSDTELKDQNPSLGTDNNDALPENNADGEKKVRPWPGKSEPGHIRPTGPAYRRDS